MEHFAPLPDRATRGSLPEPVRLRVMEELEGDASALLSHFRALGMTEQAAGREVEAWLGAGPGVWRELEEIHRPITVRWAGRLLEPQRHRVERVALLIAALLLVMAAIPVRAGVVVQAAFATGWVVLAMACTTMVLALRWFVQRRRAAASNPDRQGRQMLPVLALGTPVVGLLAAGLTVSRVGDGGVDAWHAVEVASGTLTIGMMVGIAAGVLWSVQRASRPERSRVSEGGL